MEFKDYFSKQADDYAKFRPSYPPALFEYLAALAGSHELAWDAGTGSGQAAHALARHFDRVVATDPSARQIANAVRHERILYKVTPAESTDIAARSVDLITVAQALHWFDFDRFYREAVRVLKPGGVLAAWGYSLLEISPAVDAVVRCYNREVVEPYWPPERRYLDEYYRTIPFPLAELSAPTFRMEAHWNLEELLGYLGTWSATQRFMQERGRNPLESVKAALARAWGMVTEKRTMSWLLYLRLGRIAAPSLS